LVKVITYGTYDLLHYGHIRLLERAKALGDYLIVGVTADDFDKTRGKINVQQTLMERVEAVRATGIADEIIIEEFEGQKIDDIIRYNVDIFTVGSDWKGQFDYLSDYCKVVYLERTQGISSTELRTVKRALHLGMMGSPNGMYKLYNEIKYVNGITVSGIMLERQTSNVQFDDEVKIVNCYEELLNECDAVYITSHPTKHYEHILQGLEAGKHILCESPIALDKKQCKNLWKIAKSKGLILMESIKTAYATAYNRLLLLIKSGMIGKVYSVEATCTSLRDLTENADVNYEELWNSICGWGPTAMLPVFQILGTDYNHKVIATAILDQKTKFDAFTKIDFYYSEAVGTVKVGKAVKSEGSLIISGSKGYVYVPSPWWKTDYFEIRFENSDNNKRYFYQLDGEGIRYELVEFINSIETKHDTFYFSEAHSEAIADVIQDYYSGKDVQEFKY